MKMNKRLAGLLNTPAQRWSPLLLRLQAYWRQLAPRERKILAGGGLALCLALTWQVF
ncbi:type II secretion system protein GspM, partial [Pseudomonas aeruginosa]